jgi:hypothetical protein
MSQGAHGSNVTVGPSRVALDGMSPFSKTGSVQRVLRVAGRIVRAIAREVAATIRFGAIPNAAAPRGRPARVETAAAIAGLEQLRDQDSAAGPRKEPPPSSW